MKPGPRESGISDGVNPPGHTPPCDLVLPPEMPQVPEYLAAPQRAVWDRIAPILLEHGMLTIIDGDALARLCDCIVQYQRAETEIESAGAWITNARGNLVKHPAVSIRDSNMRIFMELSKRFGLTPADRRGILPPDERRKPKRELPTLL